jgi:hypothetical protein
MAESLVSVFLPAIVLLVVAVTGVWFVGYRCRAPQQFAPATTEQEQRLKKDDDVSRMQAYPSESVWLHPVGPTDAVAPIAIASRSLLRHPLDAAESQS